jgi:hypothetical protein
MQELNERAKSECECEESPIFKYENIGMNKGNAMLDLWKDTIIFTTLIEVTHTHVFQGIISI